MAVVCNYIGKKGGGPLYAYEMTKGLIHNGVSVIAIIPDNIENIEMWNSLEGCHVVTIKGYDGGCLSLLRAVVRIIFHEGRKIKKACDGIDVDSIYIPMIQPLSLLINSFFRKKHCIVTVHDPVPHKGTSGLFSYICKKTAMRADDVVILSEKFRTVTEERFRIDSSRIHVIPHGIFDNYKYVYDNKYKHGYDKDKINFMFFGRITPYKGLDVLAEAFKRLASEFDNVALTIVGNGDFSPYQELYGGLKNVTVINRWIKDEEVYGFFDDEKVITVLPYIEATQSGVIPVAMACESLVICSNCGGLSEQVEDGVTGKLVAPGDSNELYLAMKDVVDNGVDCQIVSCAKKHVENLSWDKLSCSLIRIIDNYK